MLKIMIFSVSEEKTISQGCFWARLVGDVFSACTIQAGGNKKSPHMHKGDQRCSLTRWQPLGCSGALTASRVWRGAPVLLRSYTEVLSLSVLWEKLLSVLFQAYQTCYARSSSNTNTSSSSNVAILRGTLISRFLFFQCKLLQSEHPP